MDLTEKETEVLTDMLKRGKSNLVVSNGANRAARGAVLAHAQDELTGDQKKHLEERIKGLDERIENTVFGINTVDRLMDSIDKREPLSYHNQLG